MKSKEEIEQLATKHYKSNGSGGGQYTEGLQEGRLIGYIDGYTQCQEDMTELFKAEIKRAFIHGQGNAQGMEAGLERDETEDYVNYRMLSILNKQE